jgi:DNA gyrase/topoisomerase IV subunit A
LIAIKLGDNDELTWVKPTTGEDTLILVSKKAKSIHFHEEMCVKQEEQQWEYVELSLT